MTEIINNVLNSLGWCNNDLLKKPFNTSPAIYAENLISAILTTESVPEAAKLLGQGVQTLNRTIDKHLVPLFGKRTGGGDSWKLILLNNAEYKVCYKCNSCLKHSEFSKDKYTFDGLDKTCRNCKRLVNAAFYEENKDKYHKNYIDEHRNEYNARNAYRRAAKLKATPSWADLSKIKVIYNNCPEGYHVDHIFPLISDWVCGLHVEENLQYLPAKENLQKGNRNIGAVV